MGAPSREPRDGDVRGAPARWWRALLGVLLLAAAGAVIALAVQRRDSGQALPTPAPVDMEPSALAARTADTTAPAAPADSSEVSPARQEVPVPAPLGRAVEVERAGDAPIHGVARDSRTGEPVPQLSLKLLQRGRSELVETDAEGRYRTASAFAAGSVMVLAIDPPGQRGTQRSLGSLPLPGTRDAGLDLAVEVGPTYVFDFRLPPGLSAEDFDAALLESRERYQLSPDGWERVPLRPGDRPWARMRQAASQPVGPSAPCRVELQSRDGFWRGSTEVSSATGIYPDVLHVDVRACGTYRGRVVDDAQRPLAGVSVLVRALESAGRPSTRLFITEADGCFLFPWLPPGRCSVATANNCVQPLYELAEIEIAVAPGEETVGDLVMQRVPSAGAVSGRLSSQSGLLFFTGYQLELQSLTRPNRRLVTAAKIYADTATWAPFTFESVPEDEYELRIIEHELFGKEWQPVFRRVVPPMQGADFLMLDEGETVDLGFRVKDAETGGELEPFRLTFHAPGRAGYHIGLQKTAERARSAPKGEALRWTLAVPGYQPACGTERDFTELVAEEIEPEFDLLLSPLHLAPLELHAGWGAQLCVTGPDSLPLPGVRVLCDGQQAGRTDGDGVLMLRFAAPPGKIALEHQGWVVAAGDLDTSPGSPLNLWGEAEVRMGPRD